MTTIAAYIGAGKNGAELAIASDRAGYLNGGAIERTGSKLAKRGGWVLGAAGSAGLMRRAFLAIPEDALATADDLGASIYEWFRTAGHIDGDRTMDCTTAIIARGLEFWLLESTGCVVRQDRYAAVGSGAPYALGLLHAGWRMEERLGPKGVAALAVGAAIVHDPYTGGEIDVEVME